MTTYAFPNVHDPKTGSMAHGMTLRDYFAAQAMQAAFINNLSFNLINEDNYNSISEMSYKVADAMMKARDE